MTRGRRYGVAVLLGLTCALLAGGWFGPVLGAAVGLAAYRWLGRVPSADPQDRTVESELPFAAELLASALQGGAAPDVAARCVADAMRGPTADRLRKVHRSLQLGAPAEEAWSYLGDIAGARRIAQAATRSQHSGAAFAGSLRRLAEDLRADRLIAADAASRRAGVLIVLPLGLCFLPAFLLAGLVPVIVAILGDVLSP
jgi:pilus assembly protein TadC